MRTGEDEGVGEEGERMIIIKQIKRKAKGNGNKVSSGGRWRRGGDGWSLIRY